MDVRFCESRNHQPRSIMRTAKPDITLCAFSRTRPGHLCRPLTIDSHGSRQYGSLHVIGPESTALSTWEFLT
jgi:hypothetical protein